MVVIIDIRKKAGKKFSRPNQTMRGARGGRVREELLTKAGE